MPRRRRTQAPPTRSTPPGGVQKALLRLEADRERRMQATTRDARGQGWGTVWAVLAACVLFAGPVGWGFRALFDVHPMAGTAPAHGWRSSSLAGNRAPSLKVRSVTLKRKKKKKPVEPDQEGRKQVVTLPASDDRPPEHADYFAATNHRTARETRSRDQSNHGDIPAHARRESATHVLARGPASRARGAEGGTGEGDDAQLGEGHEGARAGAAFEIPRQAAQTARSLPEREGGRLKNAEAKPAIHGNGKRLALAMGAQGDGTQGTDATGTQGGKGRRAGDEGKTEVTLADLTPSLTELSRAAGVPFNDHLPNVETDAETRLNAWRFKHAPFFSRITRSVRRTWAPNVAVRARDPSGHILGPYLRQTQLRVTIDRAGNLTEVVVLEPSGAPYLDDEALRAMRAAGPFPNPPGALFAGKESYSFVFGFAMDGSRHSPAGLNWRPY